MGQKLRRMEEEEREVVLVGMGRDKSPSLVCSLHDGPMNPRAQARILEWAAISFPRGTPPPR